MNRQYKIPKGKHYQFSLHRLWHRFRPRRVKKGSKLTFTAVINTEPYNILPDQDQHDRHKLIGLPMCVWSRSNKDAALVSFQANPTDNTWDIAAYANKNFDWDTGAEIKLKAGQELKGEIIFIETYKVKIRFSIEENHSLSFVYNWDKPAKWTGIILPWHGGKDNNGNGVGGVSPIDINIKLTYSYTP